MADIEIRQAEPHSFPAETTPTADAAADIPASHRWDTSTKRTVVLLLLGVIVFTFWISRQVLPWVIIAGILSYLLHPIVDLLTRVRIPRAIATIVIFLIVALLMVLLPVFLVPVLIEQGRQLASFDVSGTATSVFNWTLRTLGEMPEEISFFGIIIPTGSVVEQMETGFRQVTFVPTLAEVLSYIQQGIATATGIVTSTAVLSVTVVRRIFSGLITAIVIFFLSLYLTKDMPLIRRYVEGLFPESYQPELRELFRRIGYIWSSFFRGQIILSTIIGVITWIVLTLVGMPGALILAITAGVLEVIPNIGPIIATIPAVIVALIQGSSVLAEYGVGNVGFALITIGIYFIIQQAEASIIVPRIIGDSVDLHPVVIICGVAVGFSAFGVLGAFLAAPVLASARQIGSYVHAKLLDYPPFHNKPPLGAGGRKRSYRVRVTGGQLATEATRTAPPLTDLPPVEAHPPAVEPEKGAPMGGPITSTGDASPRISSSPIQ
jgi:predicted PurR-regulated permease PerM